MVFCSECGTELKDNAQFCSKCGNEVKINNKDEINVIDIPEPKMNKWAALLVAILIVLFFPIGIIALIILYWDLRNKKGEWQREMIITRLDKMD